MAILTVVLQVFNNIFIYFVVEESNTRIVHIEEQSEEMSEFNKMSLDLREISTGMRSAYIMDESGERKLLLETIIQSAKNLTQSVDKISGRLTTADAIALNEETVEYVDIVNYVTGVIKQNEPEKARLTLLDDESEKAHIISGYFSKIERILIRNEHDGLASIKHLMRIENLVVLGLLIFAAALSMIMYKIASTVGRRFGENISQLTNAAKKLDLTARLKASGENEIAELSDNFNHFAENMHSAMGIASKSSHAVSSASHQLFESTQQLQMALGQQSSQVGEITDAMNQAAETVLDVTQRMQGVEVNVGTIATRVESTAENMDKLKEESTAINGIVETIQDISEQVNLLALNAAIEAARAGDAGKGFAVVADEVRKLAAKTNDSTDEIRTAVNSLQHQVDEAHTALGEITGSVSKISGEVQSVAAASTEQSSTIEEIGATITSFAGMISQNEEATKQANHATDSLKQEAENLDAEIQKFIL
jgi:methyl-accepting chemotaxis protein